MSETRLSISASFGFDLRSAAARIASACDPVKAPSFTDCAAKVASRARISAGVGGSFATSEGFGAGTCGAEASKGGNFATIAASERALARLSRTRCNSASTKIAEGFFCSSACLNAATSSRFEASTLAAFKYGKSPSQR